MHIKIIGRVDGRKIKLSHYRRPSPAEDETITYLLTYLLNYLLNYLLIISVIYKVIPIVHTVVVAIVVIVMQRMKLAVTNEADKFIVAYALP